MDHHITEFIVKRDVSISRGLDVGIGWERCAGQDPVKIVHHVQLEEFSRKCGRSPCHDVEDAHDILESRLAHGGCVSGHRYQRHELLQHVDRDDPLELFSVVPVGLGNADPADTCHFHDRTVRIQGRVEKGGRGFEHLRERVEVDTTQAVGGRAERCPLGMNTKEIKVHEGRAQATFLDDLARELAGDFFQSLYSR